MSEDSEEFKDWGSSQIVTVPGYGWFGATVLAIGLVVVFGGLAVVLGLALAGAL